MPPVIADLVRARNEVRSHYENVLERGGHKAKLNFMLDGNLVGDIGEALAVELLGIKLVEAKSLAGIDGYAPDGRTVQIKATDTKRGPAFRPIEQNADHLIYFCLDFDNCSGVVFYTGPEEPVLECLKDGWTGQRLVSRKRIKELDAHMDPALRLPFLADTAVLSAE